MTPVVQTKVVVWNSKGEMVVRGNCFAAAIASMLDLPITEVPNVETLFGVDDWLWSEVMDKWLKARGKELVKAPQYGVFHYEGEKAFREDLRNDYYFASGKSPRGVSHICIFRGGDLVWDPHPTHEGITDIFNFQILISV